MVEATFTWWRFFQGWHFVWKDSSLEYDFQNSHWEEKAFSCKVLGACFMKGSEPGGTPRSLSGQVRCVILMAVLVLEMLRLLLWGLNFSPPWRHCSENKPPKVIADKASGGGPWGVLCSKWASPSWGLRLRGGKKLRFSSGFPVMGSGCLVRSTQRWLQTPGGESVLLLIMPVYSSSGAGGRAGPVSYNASH